MSAYLATVDWRRDGDFASRRYVSATGDFAYGERNGREVFASLTAGWDIEHGAWRVSPYGRANIIEGTLARFTETSGGDYALTYANQSVSALNGVIGLHGVGAYSLKSALIAPQFRLEYQHDFRGAGDAALNYSNWIGGPTYVTTVDPERRDHVIAGVGADLKVGQALFGLNLNTNFTAGQHPEEAVSVKVEDKF